MVAAVVTTARSRTCALVVSVVAAVTAATLVPGQAAYAGGGVTVVRSGADLTITGTDLNDAVVIEPVLAGGAVVSFRVREDRPLIAGAGCAPGSAKTEVVCPAWGVTHLYVDLGPDDDALTDSTALDTTIFGGDGNDSLNTGGIGGVDLVVGGPGDDRLFGGTGDNYLTGDAGDDLIFGGPGQDYLSGGDGDDRLIGEDSADWLSGGNGTDVASYQETTQNVTASLDGVIGNDGTPHEHDTIAADVEGIDGGEGDDYLTGNDQRNSLHGNGGNDVITGGGGGDPIRGGSGADWLDGGDGADLIEGDEGADFLLGGPANDELHGGEGWDGLSGGVGVDACDPGDAEPTAGCEL